MFNFIFKAKHAHLNTYYLLFAFYVKLGIYVFTIYLFTIYILYYEVPINKRTFYQRRIVLHPIY